MSENNSLHLHIYYLCIIGQSNLAIFGREVILLCSYTGIRRVQYNPVHPDYPFWCTSVQNKTVVGL